MCIIYVAFVYVKKGCLLYVFRFCTMHYTINTEFSITLFGLFSSLFNQIENLTLITKFQGAPIFWGP